MTVLEPAKRLYDVPRQPTTEAGIHVVLARRSLYGAGRRAEGRRLRRAALFQSAGALHLARRRWSCSSAARCRCRIGGCGSARRGRRAAAGARRRRSEARLTMSVDGAGSGSGPGARVLMLLAGPVRAGAVEPDEILTDPALEARARAISADLRCLVCQNQSIDDCNAPLARDLRAARARAAEGRRQRRGGAAVRRRALRRVRAAEAAARLHTLLLWLAPLLLLAGAAADAWASAVAPRWRRPAATATAADGEAGGALARAAGAKGAARAAPIARSGCAALAASAACRDGCRAREACSAAAVSRRSRRRAVQQRLVSARPGHRQPLARSKPRSPSEAWPVSAVDRAGIEPRACERPAARASAGRGQDAPRPAEAASMPARTAAR